MTYSYPCLKDYFKDDYNLYQHFSAIFSQIATLSGDIWEDFDNELFSEMGMEYYLERHERPLKVLYWHYLENGAVDFEDSTSIVAFMTHIAKVAYNRFGHNWEAIYEAYFLTQYKPLENYDMEQKRTPDLDYETKTNRDQKTHVDTSGKTKVVPFNASTSTLTGESEGDSETTESKLYNEIIAHTDETGTDTLTRHGNIGVTTSQQMLQSELDLRKLDFQKIIFRDIDKILLRNYYPLEREIIL